MPNDVEILTELNHDYVMSVRDADARRFDQILAPDFLCTPIRMLPCSTARSSSR
jgi:hypothetical protein